MTGREFYLKLIEAIEARPSLYNYNLKEYGKKDISEKNWLEVANETGKEVAICKDKWRNLRTVFTRHFKKSNTKYHLYDNLKFLIPFMRYLDLGNDDGQISNDIQIVYTSSAEEELDNSESIENYSEIKIEPIEIGEDVNKDDSYVFGCNDISTEKEIDSSTMPICTEKTSIKRQRQEEIPPQFDCKRRKQEEEAKTAFLMSLLPDFFLMNNQQSRRFKKRISEVVEEILDGHQNNN
ncbi:uncharacterized protein LOC123671514 [Harmonia axyridis]|uniref:uncharacterized protein LOC123671514 n=1 Tax=Harmonia axyridis TaxID=115357 RepID=UPI001E278E90|nr:uncharacterized protein LOC123671514 [Harmonia axyridis]